MPQPGVGFSVASVSQPVVSPLFNTRGTGDIILDLASRLGLGESMPWSSMKDYLRHGWQQIFSRDPQTEQDFDTFWREILQSGVWGENIRRDASVTIAIASSVIENIAVADAEFAGDSEDFPFVLHPYLSTGLYDGRGANLPWMQELPDPMTSVVYGSWVEMNPDTAKTYGLKDGDLVAVTSAFGSIEAPVLVFPAIRPDVVAMPIGQGHEALGRYAKDRGANPLRILAPTTQSSSGILASSATRVSLVATGRKAAIVRTGGESRQLGRNIVQTTGGDSGNAAHSAKLNSIPIVVESA